MFINTGVYNVESVISYQYATLSYRNTLTCLLTMHCVGRESGHNTALILGNNDQIFYETNIACLFFENSSCVLCPVTLVIVLVHDMCKFVRNIYRVCCMVYFVSIDILL